MDITDIGTTYFYIFLLLLLLVLNITIMFCNMVSGIVWMLISIFLDTPGYVSGYLSG